MIPKTAAVKVEHGWLHARLRASIWLNRKNIQARSKNIPKRRLDLPSR
jgi:hypothetical protein